VATGDVGLMHIHVIVENPNSTVGVNVAIADDHIPVAFRQMDTVSDSTDLSSCHSKLDGTFCLNPIRCIMVSLDSQSIDQRPGLAIPHLRPASDKVLLCLVRADELHGRPGACHHQLRSSGCAQCGISGFIQLHGNRFGNAIRSVGKRYCATEFHRPLNGGSIIGTSVADRSMFLHIRP